jgi:protease I
MVFCREYQEPTVMPKLDGCRVAILATDGFEQSELQEPLKALKDAGARVDIVSPKAGRIQGFKHFDRGAAVAVNKTLADADPADYDGLVLPGGVHNPDRLRIDEAALEFTRAFFVAEKPVAAICHAPWLLIDAGVANGRKLTSYKSVRTDLRNAGATVINEEFVIDGNLITSRGPDDLPAFCRELIAMLDRQSYRRAAA